MARGGYRAGAGRKPKQTVLPPEQPYLPPDASPLEFLEACMRDERLPLDKRMWAAVSALPYRHAKPILGLKEARRLASYDDDGDDPMALAMSGN